MKATTTLAFIGPHAAGKSTLGRAVAARLGWPFHEEIGERLLLHPDGLDIGDHALTRPEAFDRAVLLEELARDAAWRGGSRVVETWHAGNLAYALHRNPLVGHALGCSCREAARRAPGLVVQPVTAAAATLRARCREPGPPGALEDYFLRVADTAAGLARQWGALVLEPLHTDRLTLEEAVDRVVAALAASHLARAA